MNRLEVSGKKYGGETELVKQITLLSGKGGTGKTTITASLAALTKNVVVTDCDVDAPDLHMLLEPEVLEKQEFTASKTAVIDTERCVHCGKCARTADSVQFRTILLTPSYVKAAGYVSMFVQSLLWNLKPDAQDTRLSQKQSMV
jgi:CO dehydrogenase nickel-insertion accessory protein CooC1